MQQTLWDWNDEIFKIEGNWELITITTKKHHRTKRKRWWHGWRAWVINKFKKNSEMKVKNVSNMSDTATPATLEYQLHRPKIVRASLCKITIYCLSKNFKILCFVIFYVDWIVFEMYYTLEQFKTSYFLRSILIFVGGRKQTFLWSSKIIFFITLFSFLLFFKLSQVKEKTKRITVHNEW